MKIPERNRVLSALLAGLFLICSLTLSVSPSSSAEPVQLVKDINLGPNDGPSIYSSIFISISPVINGTYFFLADDGIHGTELWKSDGTLEGTRMVKDIRPGMDSSLADHLTNVNGTLYFVANDGTNGSELWKSDGTAAGTAMVKDIIPGPGSGIEFLGIFFGYNTQLMDFNGTLFFAATNGMNGVELWKSDGTPGGTTMVKDIWPGPNSSFDRGRSVVNDILLFEADDGIHGTELWKTDGTTEGTLMVADLNPSGSTSINGHVQVGDLMFFGNNDHGSFGFELWKSDGTTEGTVMVKDINPGIESSNVHSFRNVNGTLFFNADDGVNGTELWKSDGTAPGTVMVKNINPSTEFSFFLFSTNVKGTLFFVADDGIHGNELWKSDGTEGGTVLVKDIRAGSLSSSPGFSSINVNGTLFFTADEGINGNELWKSDGTEAGTVLVDNIQVGSGSSNPRVFTFVNGTLFFFATRPDVGEELFSLKVPSRTNDVVLNLPSGVTVLLNDNTSSVVLEPDTAEAIAIADVDNNGVDDIIASFAPGSGPPGPGKTWIAKNGGPLSPLFKKTAESITVGNFDGIDGDDLFLDFGADGLGLYLNDTSVVILTPLSPIAMASGDVDNSGQDDVVLSFDAFGTIVFKNFSLPIVTLDSSAAEMLAVVDMDNNGEDDIIASFAPGTGPGGTGGLFFSMNQGPLTFVANVRAEQVVFGNFDGINGDDVLFDLGPDGLWLLKNNINAQLLTTLSPVAMASGDMDSSGQDDMILSFDAFGTIAFKNFSLPIEVLDTSVALDIATGNVDEPLCGNGKVDTGETCDTGVESATCDANCTLAFCGDGTLNTTAGETCDDFNLDNTDSCTNTCQAASCGDGFLQTGVEACDDGNVFNGDGCQDDCAVASFCDPLNPSAICESGFACYPQSGGTALCVTAGTGTQGDLCTNSLDCAEQFACITLNDQDKACLQWCTSSADCAGGLTCNLLSLFIVTQQFGVCN